MSYIDVTGKTEDEAIRKGLEQLGMDRDDVSVEILERAKSGFLGMGAKPARVRVTYGPDEAPMEEVAVPVKPVVEKVEKKEEPKPEVKEVENKIFTVAEQMPSFKGNVNSWLSSHLQYPAVAAENGIQGRVIVKFVVGKDGSVSQAQVVRGVDPALDREALRVVNAMPRWNPGMNNGQPANVWFTLPINFKLQ